MSFVKEKFGSSSKASGVTGYLSGTSSAPNAVLAVGAVGSSSNNAYLGVGSSIVGKLLFTGSATLGGRIEGEIKAEGRLEIGETAEVLAHIDGSEVVIRGTVQGDIIASRKLLLLKPARVLGNVSCGSLHIEDGAIFEGSCKMLKTATATSSEVAHQADAASQVKVSSEAKASTK